MDIGTKSSKAAFSIENILEQKTRTARSPTIDNPHRSQSRRGSSQSPATGTAGIPSPPSLAIPKASLATSSSSATSSSNIYDLSREAAAAQYALKNMDSSGVLAPTSLRFNPRDLN